MMLLSLAEKQTARMIESARRSISCCIILLAFVGSNRLKASTILENGGFSGSLAFWKSSGGVYSNGDDAILSDASTNSAAIFQSGALPVEVGILDLSFDVFNGISPSVLGGYLPDAFFATLYFGPKPLGSTLAEGSFEQAVALFDMDAGGSYNAAAEIFFGPSPKGAGWTRFHMTKADISGTSANRFVTVSFEFYNLNGVGSDSVVAIDNVSLITVVPEPKFPVLLLGLSGTLMIRNRRQTKTELRSA